MHLDYRRESDRAYQMMTENERTHSMNRRAIRHKYRSRFLHGLAGTILADAMFATCAFIVSVSSQPILVPVFIRYLPAAGILALNAGLSNKIVGSRHRFAFWLGFGSFLFGALGDILIGVLVVERLHVFSYDDRIAIWLLANILTVAIGAVCQWIVIGFLLLWRPTSMTPPTG